MLRNATMRLIAAHLVLVAASTALVLGSLYWRIGGVIEVDLLGTIHGAKAAGMRVIGFTGGSHSYPGHGDLLMEAGAETVIRRWPELKGVLGALASWSEIA